MTLVVDLDATLIHSVFEEEEEAYEEYEQLRQREMGEAGREERPKVQQFSLTLNDGAKLRVNVRPGLDTFLPLVAQNFELVLFTASVPIYADAILDVLDPNGTMFKHRLYRQHCTQPPELQGLFAKDLKVLG
jgi:TFIIF-interacting CTD phosphatase-like protein